MTFSHPLFKYLILAGILALSLWIRVNNFATHIEFEDRYFDAGLPLIVNVDGYYFLDLARDLLTNTYSTFDTERVLPDGTARPSPPPLLSALTAAISWLSGTELEWIAVFVPAILGALIVIPMFALGWAFGGSLVAAIAALVAALSPHFLVRTSLGWFDTDCGVVALALTNTWLVVRFADAINKVSDDDIRPWWWLIATIPVTMVFVWWWEFGSAPALASALLPLAAALTLPSLHKKSRVVILILGITTAALVEWLTPGTLASFSSKLFYLLEIDDDSFPSAAINVAEQRNPDITEIALRSMAGWPGFILALIGLLILVVRQPQRAILLVFPLSVAFLSLVAARFMIFVGPVVGLGIGMLVKTIYDTVTVPKLKWIVTGTVIAIVLAPLLLHAYRDDAISPLRLPYQVAAMKELNELLPGDAAIFADWSHGHPLKYLSRRAIFADGAHHSGRRVYGFSNPLAMTDARQAANALRFYSVYGPKGYDMAQSLLDADWNTTMNFLARGFAAGPDAVAVFPDTTGINDQDIRRQWVDLLFPVATRPIYIYLDFDKIRTPWYTFGSWDFTKREGQKFAHTPILNLKVIGHTVFNDRVMFNLDTGDAQYLGQQVPVRRIIVLNKSGQRYVRNISKLKGWNLEIDLNRESGLLFSDNVADSVGRRLYAGNMDVRPYFEPVLDNLPYVGVWQVLPDMLLH